MENCIKISGELLFDPRDFTSKQERQGVWKKTAMVMIPGDIHHYYAWFLRKRYNLPLVPPVFRFQIIIKNEEAPQISNVIQGGVVLFWLEV